MKRLTGQRAAGLKKEARGLCLLFILILSPWLLAPAARAADPNQLTQKALKLYEKGEYDKALKIFVKVLQINPEASIAREYMLRCSQKIVEKKLGTGTAETVEREINVERQIQEIASSTETSLSPHVRPELMKPPQDAPITIPLIEAKPEAAAAPAASSPLPASAPAPGEAEPAAPGSEDASLSPEAATALPGMKDWQGYSSAPDAGASAELAPPEPAPAPAEAPTARDLLLQRETLTDELRRRFLGREDIVQIKENGDKLEITFFLNRLFMPYSDTLRSDAYPVLDQVIAMLKTDPKRKIIFRAVDSASPAVQKSMADLPARRTTVIFSYLIYTSYRPSTLALSSRP